MRSPTDSQGINVTILLQTWTVLLVAGGATGTGARGTAVSNGRMGGQGGGGGGRWGSDEDARRAATCCRKPWT